MDKIRAVIIKRNDRPEIAIINKDIDLFETIVGGYVEISHIFGDICIIHNERLTIGDIGIGNFIVAAIDDNDDICSLTDNQLNYVLTAITNPKNLKFTQMN